MKTVQEKSVGTEPELGREAIEAIEKARARIKKGRFRMEEGAEKRLGLQ